MKIYRGGWTIRGDTTTNLLYAAAVLNAVLGTFGVLHCGRLTLALFTPLQRCTRIIAVILVVRLNLARNLFAPCNLLIQPVSIRRPLGPACVTVANRSYVIDGVVGGEA